MPRSNEEANANVRRRWLSDPSLCRHLDISRTSLHRLRKDPDKKFPKPVKIGSLNHTDVDEVDPWVLAQASSSDASSDGAS